MADSTQPRESWAPLRAPQFRAFWLAAFASNVGSWMHSVAAAWLMTAITPSPLLAALVQTAGTLPLFLFSLPAGAYADLMDRRRLLLWTQSAMLLAALSLGALALAGHAGAATLLALTFAMGAASAWNAPAWAASIPELVPREDLPAAVLLNSVQFNAARAVGPALGGLLLIAASPGAVFLVNAASFLIVIAVIRDWKGVARGDARAQRLLPFIAQGLGFARRDATLRATLWRAVLFVVCASAMWALLPSVARHLLQTSGAGFGLMLGAMGAGAVLSGLLMSWRKARLRDEILIAVGTSGFAMSLIGLSFCRGLSTSAFALLLLGGVSWMTTMSTLNVAVQSALPDWVRARGLSIYILVFNGAMALGGWMSGHAAEYLGLPATMRAAGFCLLLLLPLAARRYTVSK